MKGNPPFSRTPIISNGSRQSLAGLGQMFRNADRLPVPALSSAELLVSRGTAWLDFSCGNSARIKFRLFNEPNGALKVGVSKSDDRIKITALGVLGTYVADIQFDKNDPLLLRLVVSLTPASPAVLDGGDPEVVVTDGHHDPLAEGFLFTRQTGPSAAQVYFGCGGGRALYFQNLTALNKYAERTGADLKGAIKVDWPALGLSPVRGEKPIAGKRPLVISDAFLRITDGSDSTEGAITTDFLDGIASIIRRISPTNLSRFDWAGAARRTLIDLQKSPCIRKIGGATYLNAYVGSLDKPPESMVQAAVMVPLIEYEAWLGRPVDFLARFAATMPSFFLKGHATMARWLPGQKFSKPEPSEEENSERMDSWYLLHTMLNLGRMAGLGRDTERELFIAGLPYLIEAAHHFNHDWPVFYDRNTWKVFKRETGDGEGGEQDACGLYAHVMMQAWKLTNDRMYIQEAETAASKLHGLGFGILYQTNNTMFSAIALAWLWKETDNAKYKDLSVVCMGSILSHLWLWEPHRRNTPLRTFMGLPPLHDAPYIAPYEEAEVFATSRIYLEILGHEVPPSLEEIIVEYGRHLLDRGRYYFPKELPAAALSDDPKEGHTDRPLAIPVEDLYPSDEKVGQVGQEVYGAAMPFILATKSTHRWHGAPLSVWSDAPIQEAELSLADNRKSGTLTLTLRGGRYRRFTVSIKSRRVEAGQIKVKYRDSTRYLKPTIDKGAASLSVNAGRTILVTW